jgi:glycosyltransferase involved in cell wall biosynthesis
MRIGIDCRLWDETGVGRYIRNLIWELQDLDKKNEYVLFVKKGFKTYDLRFKNERSKIVETNIHWHSLSEQIKFPQILYKENLDLMHFPYFSLPIFYNKSFVVTIHDLIINHFPTGKASTLPYPFYLLKRIGYDFVMHHAVNNSAKIIVPLNAVKEDLIKTYNIAGDKIAVTKEGAALSKDKKNTKYKIPNTRFAARRAKYFLYVGNAYPHKNLEFLIDAFVEFKNETKDDTNLVLVGKDDFFYQRLRRKVEEKKLKNVVFKHNIADEELLSLYSNAIALVSTSLMEGFGLPPLEAMSSSCLVLLSDIPSFKEVCKDAAFYFNPKSKNSLKEKLGLLYNLDHKEKQEHIKKGLARVKEFSWKKMAEQTLSVYESSPSTRSARSG